VPLRRSRKRALHGAVSARAGEQEVHDAVAGAGDLGRRVAAQQDRLWVDACGGLVGGGVEPLLGVDPLRLRRLVDLRGRQAAVAGARRRDAEVDRHGGAVPRGDGIRSAQRGARLDRAVVRHADMAEAVTLAGAGRRDRHGAGAAL